jgi:hypothetical protein
MPMNRYAKMVESSPFAVATPVEAPVAAPSFAASLYVAGIAKIGTNDLVTIRSRNDPQTLYSLLTGEQSPDGVNVLKVDWSDQVGRSRVKVKKGAEEAMLEFDQATLQKKIAPVAPAGSAGRGGIGLPGQSHAGPVMPPMPSIPQPNSQVPPIPTAPASPQSSGHSHSHFGTSSDSGSPGQRRIRIIPSRPAE